MSSSGSEDAGVENVCPQAWGGGARVARELRRLMARPPPGVRVVPADKMDRITAFIEGPAETPYAGGVFRVSVTLGARYPHEAPLVSFVTRVFHPNVCASGRVCVDTLSRGWRPALGVAHALSAVRCLLIAPNAESALNEEAAALLRDDYRQYAARARLYTEIHARAPGDYKPVSSASEEDASGAGPAGKEDISGAGPAGKEDTSGAGPAGKEDASGAGPAGAAALPSAPPVRPGSGSVSVSGAAGSAAGPAAKRERRAGGHSRRVLKRL